MTFEGTIDGVNWANVFWVRNGAGQTPTVNDLTAFCADMFGRYQGNLLKVVHSAAVLTKCVAIYYGPTGGDLGSEAAGSAAGALGGTPCSSQVATCISWHVVPRYRGGHPRTYLPPPATSSMASPRLWVQAQVDEALSAANDFHAAVNAMTHGQLSDLHLGTVSFVLRNAWRTPPVFRDYSPGLASVDKRIDTMRRRLGRDIV